MKSHNNSSYKREYKVKITLLLKQFQNYNVSEQFLIKGYFVFHDLLYLYFLSDFLKHYFKTSFKITISLI